MHINSVVRRTTHEATPWRSCLSDTMESVCLFRCVTVNAISPYSTVIGRCLLFVFTLFIVNSVLLTGDGFMVKSFALIHNLQVSFLV